MPGPSDGCLHFEGRAFVGNPCFSSSGRHRPRGLTTTNPSQLWFAVRCGRLCTELRREAESKKTPFEGVWGVNPKQKLRLVGVVGAALHADASAR